jgi:predicted anti-sigma-YlaC factor YlaD
MHVAVREWSCARARRALSLVLDREEAAGDLQSLATHLGSCGACRAFALEVTQLTRHLRSLRVAPSDITERAGRENSHA